MGERLRRRAYLQEGAVFRLQERSDSPQSWALTLFSIEMRCENAAAGGETASKGYPVIGLI